MGMPFRDGFGLWLERAPGFNTGRVKTPLRSETYSLQGVLTHWEMHIALKMLKKPTELVIFQDGAHELVKPRQRYASLQGNVDWFSFWLQGKEDPDAEKAEQYARWRELKKLQEKNASSQ